MTNNAEYLAAVDQLFALPSHGNEAVCKWLSCFLKGLDWPSLNNPALSGFRSYKPGKLPPEMQIALLKLCLELMVRMREQRCQPDSPDRRREFYISHDIGGVLYSIALGIFRRPQPFSERDICEILETSRHGCGHGEDVLPPFQLALAYARKHGLSAKLLNAIKLYVGRMEGLRSCKVQNVRRKVDLLLTMDGTIETKRCWSDRFRTGLAELPELQQQKWRAMVVDMDAMDFGRNYNAWKTKAPQFITSLGAKHLLDCLSAWWPSPTEESAWPLQTGGSHLLEHFVWLLEVIAEKKRYTARCDSLIVQLSELDWKPRERALKVMVAAAQYLEQRPPAVAWVAIERLNAWSAWLSKKKGYTLNKISDIAKAYAEEHGLSDGTKSV